MFTASTSPQHLHDASRVKPVPLHDPIQVVRCMRLFKELLNDIVVPSAVTTRQGKAEPRFRARGAKHSYAPALDKKPGQS